MFVFSSQPPVYKSLKKDVPKEYSIHIPTSPNLSPLFDSYHHSSSDKKEYKAAYLQAYIPTGEKKPVR